MPRDRSGKIAQCHRHVDCVFAVEQPNEVAVAPTPSPENRPHQFLLQLRELSVKRREDRFNIPRFPVTTVAP